MNDLLPHQSPHWQLVEENIRAILASYGYAEIRFPILESTALFSRSIGEVTDIVEKEMYSFEDRNGDSLTLRPEGTAGCVRAAIQGSLLNRPQRLWYQGPMFRHERPQKGRLRQFHQFGVETFGLKGPDIDAEILAMTATFWRRLGIGSAVSLEINSLGSPSSRQAHKQALVSYFEERANLLDADSQRRLQTNPLRILDSKNPDMQQLVEAAPQLADFLDDESKQHFAEFQSLLNDLNIPYRVNPRLVRGLDYYGRTVFEWVTDALGAQGTVCGGGRYDALVEQLGGPDVPACGFGLGIERLVLLIEAVNPEFFAGLGDADIYILGVPEAQSVNLRLAEQIRFELPHLKVVCHCGNGSFKSQFKKADRSGAKLALICGESELSSSSWGVKNLREEREQQTLQTTELIAMLRSL
jgi:histidyl-tRNA synthetase